MKKWTRTRFEPVCPQILIKTALQTLLVLFLPVQLELHLKDLSFFFNQTPQKFVLQCNKEGFC